ncbi:MAG: hypothetical protein N4A43_00600 [Alphaproteobacteria bacterium]|jgi:type II secretory pathway pseudopilin PulG|nr:hypothetical protein [Alphaproteobacteria bacterium]
MSSLIVTIIAIALVAVAALISAFYGASSWTKGQDTARATTLINQKAQIKAAAEAHRGMGFGVASSIDDLKTQKLLNNVPIFENTTWNSADDKVFVSIPAEIDAQSVCEQAYQSEQKTSEAYVIKPCGSVTSKDVCCYSGN